MHIFYGNSSVSVESKSRKAARLELESEEKSARKATLYCLRMDFT